MGFCLLANGSIDGEPKDFNGWTLSLGNSIDLEIANGSLSQVSRVNLMA